MGPLSPAIHRSIVPQLNTGTKYNHFQFADRPVMEKKLTRVIQSVKPNVQVQYHYNVKKYPDVTLTDEQTGNVVGKVHFLHFNRPDMCDRSKWFVKLYFYEFDDQSFFDQLKAAMVGFFRRLESAFPNPARPLTNNGTFLMGGRGGRRTKRAKRGKKSRRRPSS